MYILTTGEFGYVKLQAGGYCLTKTWSLYSGIVGWSSRVFDNITKKLILDHSNAGWLTLHASYCWDGASGPVIDRKANMRAGNGHDGGYRLLREGLLPQSFRQRWDEIYTLLYLSDVHYETEQLNWLRRGIGRRAAAIAAKADYIGLRAFAGYAAKPQPEIDTIKLSAP